MEATLIMLDNPILVNEEEIKTSDIYLDTSVFHLNNEIKMGKGIYQMKHDKWGEEGQGGCRKILAGHEGTERLTFQLKDENAKRIGYVDVEKLIKSELEYMTDYEKINYNLVDGYVRCCIKTYASLTPKKYTEEQLAILIVEILHNEMKGINLGTQFYLDAMKQPPQYQVECTETEKGYKVTKIL